VVNVPSREYGVLCIAMYVRCIAMYVRCIAMYVRCIAMYVLYAQTGHLPVRTRQVQTARFRTRSARPEKQVAVFKHGAVQIRGEQLFGNRKCQSVVMCVT
jgi:hypothetical protein